MCSGIVRILAVAVEASWLAACSTVNDSPAQASDPTHPFAQAAGSDNDLNHPFTKTAAVRDERAAAQPETTGTLPQPLGVPAAADSGLLGSNPYDDLSLGKKQYRANNFGLAEKHFRRAVELHPRDSEAWLGLAASYDGQV
jgi:hypothetical protein